MHRPWFSPDEYMQLYKATRAARRKRIAALPVERGAGARLRAVHGQHRPSSGRGQELAAPRRDRGAGPGHGPAHPRDRGARQARRRLLQEHAGRRLPVSALAEAREACQRRPARSRAIRSPPIPSSRAITSSCSTACCAARTSSSIATATSAPPTAFATPTSACGSIEGADIYALAKNCRTSVEMIQKFYAAHIKDLLDASAINIRRRRLRQASKEGSSLKEPPELRAGPDT